MEEQKKSEALTQATLFEIKSAQKFIDALAEEQDEQLKKEHKAIEKICLSGNSYGFKFFQQFAPYVSHMHNLKLCNFENLFVGRKKDEIPDSLAILSKSLIGKSILEIDISNNALNPFGAKAISPYLKQASTLKTFLINNCGLGPEGTQIIAESLQEGAGNLEVWAIARNRAEDLGAEAVGKAVKSMPKLRQLHIYQDVIRKKGMVQLLQGLQTCAALELLDLRDNFLKEEAVNEIVKLIKVCKKLHSLNLSDCNLSEDDNDTILDALEEAKLAIEKFGYNYNELNGDQAKHLLDIILKDSSKLKLLQIKGNEFKKSTKQYYLEKLKEKNLEKVLSAFESDNEDDEANLMAAFAELKI